MAKQKWQGKKSTGSHTTLIGVAVPLIKKAEEMPEVEKISPGFIKATPGSKGKRGMKFTPVQGGLKIIVRGNSSIQEIWIYTNSPIEVQKKLQTIQL